VLHFHPYLAASTSRVANTTGTIKKNQGDHPAHEIERKMLEEACQNRLSETGASLGGATVAL
jgi:hypothetical protein